MNLSYCSSLHVIPMSVLKLFFISTNYARLKLIVNILKNTTTEPFVVHFICLTNIITVIGFFAVHFFVLWLRMYLFMLTCFVCCYNTSDNNHIQSFEWQQKKQLFRCTLLLYRLLIFVKIAS